MAGAGRPPGASHNQGQTVFEQAFKNIDDALRKEAGCTTELDYTEQTSWLLFLKYLDGLEQDKATEAALAGKPYSFILEAPYRWESWAAPKGRDGKLDHNTALTGDDLRDFVNGRLFPYLHGFTQRASGPNTIEYKIGQIFAEIKNKILSGYNLRDIIERIDELRFRSQAEKHELSALYEEKIKRMGNAGRNGGERPAFIGVAPGRRRNMQANGSKNTKPEMVVRQLLHSMGYRYQLHRRELPGKPDIVFLGRRKAIEVRGCFWHGHGCHPLGKMPQARREYWVPKITATKERDARNMATLRQTGWEVLEIWECKLRAMTTETGTELAEFLGPVRADKKAVSRGSFVRCRAA